ncbi:MAG: hypothetical protein PHU06_02980 [Gallionella sp.]|nr:hypothetical protein [Gallionella sp.]MDD4958217.1 hypothetical protein [Gallionella sp.]
MATKKKTLYEILGVASSASLDEIKAAHKSQLDKLFSVEQGLSREEIHFQRQILDVALFTLSSSLSRDDYDAKIAAPPPPAPVIKLPAKVGENSLRIADAMERSNQLSAAMLASQATPLDVAATTVKSSMKSLKYIFRFIAGFVVLLVVIKWGVSSMAHRNQTIGTAEMLAAEGKMSSTEEKLYLQEYYQKYGVRPASKAEADLLDIERRRKENAEKAAELEKQKAAEADKKFVEESRDMANQVAINLQREEEKARYEAMRKERQLAEEKRQQEQAERIRLEAEKRRVAEERRKLGLY